MICIIRIVGEIGLDYKIKETLDRLRIRKKYSCVVIEKPNDVQLGMLKSVADFVAFGEINDETYKKLKEARGKKVAGKLKPFLDYILLEKELIQKNILEKQEREF